MIGFGWETWRSTLPEDEGERMGCGKRETTDRRREFEPGGVVCGRSLLAEAVVTSFAVRTGTNPLVLI